MGKFDKRTPVRAPRVLRRKNIGVLREQLLNDGVAAVLTSQHSMVIDDDTGLNVRLDINDAFQAQAGNQLGATEPPVMYAGQFWADTGTMKLKQRNSDNTAWVVLGILDKTALLTVNNISPDANGNVAISFTVADISGAVTDTRTVNGHALSTDVNVTAQDIFNTQAVSIASGTDLNSLSIPGIYYNPADANATAALNYPSTNAGSLVVYKDAGITQIYTEYGSGNSSKPRQYRRGMYSNTWSAWEQVYDTGNPPPTTDLSPYMKTTDANAKFVQGVQFGAETITNYDRYSDTIPGTSVSFVAYESGGGGDVESRCKPIQRNINGSWVTISG